MARQQHDAFLRIGELAERAGTSTDTVRYYERLGLLAVPSRSDNGYRRYSAANLGQLQFIRRAKRLGLSLEDIRRLIGIAEAGECQPLRYQVAELLAQKIEECEAQLAEISRIKASLEELYRLALGRLNEPACGCAAFPATCECLPIPVTELHAQQNGATNDA